MLSGIRAGNQHLKIHIRCFGVMTIHRDLRVKLDNPIIYPNSRKQFLGFYRQDEHCKDEAQISSPFPS